VLWQDQEVLNQCYNTYSPHLYRNSNDLNNSLVQRN
jgi:hypothetical protein